MSEDTDLGAPAEQPAIERSAPADAPERMSATEAARLLSSLRRPKESASARAQQAAPVEQPESEPAQAEDDAAPVETQAPGETQEADPAPQESPIDPPRSWTKEQRERWQSLPRETQEYLADREQERERELRKVQNEAADARKAADAERSKVETARQQYEQALPQLLATLESQQAGEFADIKGLADVEKLMREDWPRYLAWDFHQKKVNAVKYEMEQSKSRQQQEQSQKFVEFAKREDSLLAEKVPDMADPKKAERLQKAAVNLLKDLGFEDGELQKAWNSREALSLRDHRLQALIVDAIHWREAQAKAKTVIEKSKPLPPVQRPGTPLNKGEAESAKIQQLNDQLAKSSGLNALRVAAQLRAAQVRTR